MDKGVDLFNNRLLSFPLHLGTHWTLAATVVELSTHQISYYASLKNENPACIQILQGYLVQVSQDTEFCSTEW